MSAFRLFVFSIGEAGLRAFIIKCTHQPNFLRKFLWSETSRRDIDPSVYPPGDGPNLE